MPPKRAPQRADRRTKRNNSIPSEICANRFARARKERTFFRQNRFAKLKTALQICFAAFCVRSTVASGFAADCVRQSKKFVN